MISDVDNPGPEKSNQANLPLTGSKIVQRLPAELLYESELLKLKQTDQHPVPPGWEMSPIAIEKFLLGDAKLKIRRKFVGDKNQVTRIIIALATNRGAMLVGEPGTAKSLLSELLCASISGSSLLTIQGGTISDITQLLYSWNPALLKQKGPCKQALIPSPIYHAMQTGKLVRFEEIARCPQPLQDAILSILSERMLVIPELSQSDEKGVLFAKEGFNIIATSNTRDQGVNHMSAALKRRMNFETIKPIQSIDDEIAIIIAESKRLLKSSGVDVIPDSDVITMLTTIFHELRNGQSLDGRSTDRLSGTAMSTAEAVSVAHAMGVHAYYYRQGKMQVDDLVDFLVGATLKDNPEDKRRMRHYFETEVVNKKGNGWQTLYQHRDSF